MITREFNLYLHAGHSIPLVINANQYDRGEQWLFTLFNSDGTKYVPSSGAIVGIKSDKLGIINSGTVDSQGRVVINETQQMTAAVGKAVFELLIDDQSHGTANFIVLVEPKPGDNADLSESDLSLIQQAIDGTSATAIAQGVSDWMDENLTPTTPVVDTSLTVSGAAADSAKVGQEISDLKSAIEQGGTGVSDDLKTALLQLAQKVAYIDGNGQSYYDDLYDALYPPIVVTNITLNTNSLSFATLNSTQQLSATTTPTGGAVTWSSSDTSVATVNSTGLVTSVGYGNATITATSGSVSATCSVAIAQATVTSISAVYTQSGTVYETDSLDSLKSDLVVTATWSNQTTSTVANTDYTLSGTLTVGTSTITVSYGGKSATFNVTVTADAFPSEYQKVEWIGVDTTEPQYAYFDVGISLSTKSELEGYEVDYTAMAPLPRAAGKNVCAPLISWSGNAGCYFGSVAINRSSGVYGWGSVDTEGTTFGSSEVAVGEANTFHTYWNSSSGITECGSYSCSRAYVQGTASLNLRLGAGAFDSNNNGNYKFYDDIKIKKDGTLVRDLYPCYRKADSVIGFYDKITDTFYTKTGNAPIVKGADI